MNSAIAATRRPAELELSVAIRRSADQAYDFLARPENFPKWASRMGRSLREDGGDWIAQTAEGQATVRFSDRNRHGVLDYSVAPSRGSSAYIRLRILATAGGGCELRVTLFRAPVMSDERFAAEAERAMRDLGAAKRLIEARDVLVP